MFAKHKKSMTIIVMITIYISITSFLLGAQTIPSKVTKTKEINKEIVKVMNGPDKNAVYLKLTSTNHTSIEPPSYYIHRKKNDVVFNMPGFARISGPGNPALNFYSFHIALPPDVKINSIKVEVISKKQSILKGEYRIAPAPPFFYDQGGSSIQDTTLQMEEKFDWGTGKNIIDGRNSLVYNNDSLYPKFGWEHYT